MSFVLHITKVMIAKLRKKLLVFLSLFIFMGLRGNHLQAQNCNQELDFDFFASENIVNWTQFPEFSLPFTVIFSGSGRAFDQNEVLGHGFSHISNPNAGSSLSKSQKACIYYGVVSADQPWFHDKSPYGNNMEIYHKKWEEDLADLKASNNGNLDFDLFCLDIEAHLKSNTDILELKNKEYVPSALKALSDDAFILQYKKDMQALYAQAILFIKQRVNARIFTSYGETPIFNTFTNIQGASWEKWQSDPSLLNYILTDFNSKKVGGGVYDLLDGLSPNSYFYYDYPHLFAGEYLSYLMFQIEANQTWSAKNQFLYLWTRYSFTPQYVGKNIRPWMAEAMAIFPFFSGAKGLWLWDDMSEDINYQGYQYFIKGLYRLSRFKHFFEGDYQLIRTISARDYNENKQPEWRGIYNGEKMLIAAHNPWAKSDNEEVELTIKWNGLNEKIKLKGFDIFLCEYDVPTITGNEIEFVNLKVYPNPVAERLNYEFSLKSLESPVLSLTDDLGRTLYRETLKGKGDFKGTLDLHQLKAKKLYLNIQTASLYQTKTIILNNE